MRTLLTRINIQDHNILANALTYKQINSDPYNFFINFTLKINKAARIRAKP